jgi:hypothetical protein
MRSWIRWPIKAAASLALTSTVLFGASPVDFGLAEFQAASAARNRKLVIKTELSLDPPETFRIEPYTAGGAHITGGDLRGLMYGLIEAAEQMRTTGRLKPAHGVPATPLRAIRFVVGPDDLNQAWFASDANWRAYFQILARSRINRFTLAMPRLPEPPTRVRALSQMATEYGIDFMLGLAEAPAPSDVAALRSGLASLLAACPLIRGLEIEPSAALPAPPHEAFLRAVEGAGRRVIIDVRGGDGHGGSPHGTDLAQSALEMGLPLRISLPTGCAELGDASDYCYWSLQEPSPPSVEALRDRVPDFTAGGSIGFELDAPRVEGEPPALFYWVWGRITYDPKAPALPPVAPPPAPVNPALSRPKPSPAKGASAK